MGITFNPFSGTLDFTGSGGGGTIAGSIANTQVAFGTAANTIGGDATFLFSPTASLTVDPANLIGPVNQLALTVGPITLTDGSQAAGLSAAFVLNPSADAFFYPILEFQSSTDPTNTKTIDYVQASVFSFYHKANTSLATNGGYVTGQNTTVQNDGSGTIIDARGAYAQVANTGLGTIDTAFGIYSHIQNFGGGTLTTAFSFYAPELSDPYTNPYYLWFDARGVFRVRQDNTFNSVYQAIPALYNPQFTKYTPGATNFERVVLQWESNVAVITTEKGGTGTLRALQLGDASVPVQVGGSVFRPTTSDAAALGSATLQWSDLFLAEGGVINWDNGDATLTQVGDVVTLAGAALANSAPGTAANSVATIDGTQTLTNKRNTKRVVTAADATSITPNTDSADVTYQANTQAAGTLTINADGGTPTNGQPWLLKIKSTNVQTFAWNAVYVGGTVALPTTTTGSSTIDYFAFLYDTVNSKWQFTGAATGY